MATQLKPEPVQGKLLLVDDEENILRSLRRVLRRGDWLIETAPDAETALKVFERFAPAVVISDFRMPGMNGAQLLTAIRECQPDCGRVILSAHADFEGLTHAVNAARISQFMSKPWNEPELLAVVHEQLAEHRRQVETELLAEQQRLARGELSPQEIERRRLERMEPGITRVEWSDDGAYVLDPVGAAAV